MKPWVELAKKWRHRWSTTTTTTTTEDIGQPGFSVTDISEHVPRSLWWWCSWWSTQPKKNQHLGFRVGIGWSANDGVRNVTMDLTFDDVTEHEEFQTETMMLFFDPSVDLRTLRQACRKSLIGLRDITADGFDELQTGTHDMSPEKILLLLLALDRLSSVIETVP